MSINPNSFNELVELMNNVIHHGSRIRISNPNYVSFYLKIFLDEVKNNNGYPVHYDEFGDRMWTMLNVSINSFKHDADEFMRTWNDWVTLYRYLKDNSMMK